MCTCFAMAIVVTCHIHLYWHILSKYNNSYCNCGSDGSRRPRGYPRGYRGGGFYRGRRRGRGGTGGGGGSSGVSGGGGGGASASASGGGGGGGGSGFQRGDYLFCVCLFFFIVLFIFFGWEVLKLHVFSFFLQKAIKQTNKQINAMNI